MRTINRVFALWLFAIAVTGLLAVSGDAQDHTYPKLSPVVPVLESCELKRSAAGVYTMHLFGYSIQEEATFTVSGTSPKKVKFKGTDGPVRGRMKIVLKGNLCGSLPGMVIATNPDGRASAPLACNQRCRN